jgi:hypothetical protein
MSEHLRRLERIYFYFILPVCITGAVASLALIIFILTQW